MDNNTRVKLNLNQVIAYECHIKGMTFDKSSEVEHKGTFLGAVEKLDCLNKIGVNQLILMPVYEFEDSVCEVFGAPEGIVLEDNNPLHNYWGFTKGDYFRTKTSYGYNDSDKEFKYLVEQAHVRNMEIIMMIHFEHDINTEIMLESLKHWKENFNVDGFFINVNPYYLKVISDCTILKDIKLYTYHIDNNLKYTNPERIAVYDYAFRNTLRRMLRGDENAFSDYVNCLKETREFKRIVSVTSHNGFTLNDLYSYVRKHNEANGEYNRDGEDVNYSDNFGTEGDSSNESVMFMRLKAMKNALLMMILSKGVPMLLAGDEAANSQSGNNNAYCQDNECGWVQYDSIYKDELTELISIATEIRKSSGIFDNLDLLSSHKVNRYSIPGFSIHTGEAWQCNVDEFTRYGGFMYAGNDGFLYIAANFDKYDHNLSIPHLPKGFKWSIIARTDVKNYSADDALDESGTIYLKSQSVHVFISQKEN